MLKKPNLAARRGKLVQLKPARTSAQQGRFWTLIILAGLALSSCTTTAEKKANVKVSDSDFTAYLFNQHCDATTSEDEPGCERVYVKSGLTQIPLLPNRGCYRWSVYLEDGFPQDVPKGEKVIEREIRPKENMLFAGVETDEAVRPTLTDERFTHDITLHEVDEYAAHFTSAWCVTEKSKTGPQAIEIEYDGKVLKRFDFTVVPPEDTKAADQLNYKAKSERKKAREAAERQDSLG